ncbi:MAG: hypothetical protein IPL11_08330 [Candidatus Accumulibacter sp.]|nr:hypothetical protein [Accumulibacter sp.]MBN8437944.1 hypothetical protein [Accumulibacter sp.]
MPGFHDSDESKGQHWKTIPECPPGGQVAEEDQGETDGTESDRHPLERHLGKRNRSLRGWANYFHYRNSSAAMSKVRQHAEACSLRYPVFLKCPGDQPVEGWPASMPEYNAPL